MFQDKIICTYHISLRDLRDGPDGKAYPECNVKHGPVLGEVDLLAGEHGVATIWDITALGLNKRKGMGK